MREINRPEEGHVVSALRDTQKGPGNSALWIHKTTGKRKTIEETTKLKKRKEQHTIECTELRAPYLGNTIFLISATSIAMAWTPRGLLYLRLLDIAKI